MTIKVRHIYLKAEEKKICTYCSGGYRRIITEDQLNKQGFTTVTIECGYFTWKNIERRK